MELKIPTGPTGIEPTLLSYAQTCALLNVKATKLRELIRAGHLAAKKNGGQPMIPTESVRGYLASLPDAEVAR